MFEEFLRRAAELLAKGECFAVATVVRCQPPTSGKPGDKDIVHADGKMWGWIGGGCAQPVVAREAMKALREGCGRLVRISPAAGADASGNSAEGVVDYTMTCHSGGALDIYIEPVLPKPHIVILGRSPVAQTLARLATAIHYAVTVIAPEADAESFPGAEVIQNRDFSPGKIAIAPRTYVVVSTQGEGDEEALEQALNSSAAYVGFIASRTKARKVAEYLSAKGMDGDRMKRMRAPAGLDIHAASPEEIAVSILAEIVQLERSQSKAFEPVSGQVAPEQRVEARDPICGMEVDTSKAHKSEYQGNVFYFCCAGCKQTFDKQPESYAARFSG